MITTRDYIDALRHKDQAEATEIAQYAVARELGISVKDIQEAPASKYRALVSAARGEVLSILAIEMGLVDSRPPTELPEFGEDACDEEGYYQIGKVKMREPLGKELIVRATSPDVKFFGIVVACTGKSAAELYDMPLAEYLPLHNFAGKAFVG